MFHTRSSLSSTTADLFFSYGRVTSIYLIGGSMVTLVKVAITVPRRNQTAVVQFIADHFSNSTDTTGKK